MNKPTDDEIRQDIECALAAQIRAGFRACDEIWIEIDDMCEQTSDPDGMRAFASGEIDRQWTQQRASEASWTGRTDCDRLDAAFEELETIGVICRQDFTCCGTCGAAEIGLEIEGFEAKRRVTARGYAFYHMQDTESAVEGHGLYLSYGAAEPGAERALVIACEIIGVLTNHGLSPQWNGEFSKRIHVPLEWRRRFVCK